MPDFHPRIDSRGNRDLHVPANADPAIAATGLAWIGNYMTPAAAGAASLLNAKESLLHDDSAAAATTLAWCSSRAFLGARTTAFRAILFARDGNRLMGAAVCLDEIDLDGNLQIAATL